MFILSINCKKFTPDQLKRFFLKGDGKNAGFAKVRPELQQMITFRRFNLLDEQWGIREKFDVIFCRNVMIYFDKNTQYANLEKDAALPATRTGYFLPVIRRVFTMPPTCSRFAAKRSIHRRADDCSFRKKDYAQDDPQFFDKQLL